MGCGRLAPFSRVLAAQFGLYINADTIYNTKNNIDVVVGLKAVVARALRLRIGYSASLRPNGAISHGYLHVCLQPSLTKEIKARCPKFPILLSRFTPRSYQSISHCYRHICSQSSTIKASVIVIFVFVPQINVRRLPRQPHPLRLPAVPI